MRGDLLGGGVVVAVAAALWLIYLVPTWLHRREYLATERNAVRLQQTLRILAETAETPREVRLEATAREVARQRKALKAAQRRAEAQAKAAAERQAKVIAERQLRESAAAKAAADAARSAQRARADTVAAAKVSAASTVPGQRTVASPHETDAAAGSSYATDASSDRSVRHVARSRRRLRALSSLVMLASLAAIVCGAIAMLASGTWLLLAGGVAGLVGAVVALRRLAAPTVRVVAASPAVAPASTQLFDHAEHDAPQPTHEATTWTPRPLPKPLHLSRGTIAASAMASVDAAVELRRAAARAELERKAITVEPELPRLRPVASAEPATQSVASVPAGAAMPAQPARATQVAKATGTDGRYATMGVVEGVEGSRLDLDAVLRRRRA